MADDDAFAISETFRVAFEGEAVECACLADAIAIKNCDDILAQGASIGYSPSSLERFAALLLRYGKGEAAERMSQLAKQTRASQFFVDNA